MSDDDDLDKLVKLTAERNSKKRKFDLSEFDSTIEKMLGLNVSLPVIKNWFEDKEIKISLPALRRYIIRTFGNDLYTDFLERNGWTKTKSHDNTRKSRKQKNNTDGDNTHSAPESLDHSILKNNGVVPVENETKINENPLIATGIGTSLQTVASKPKVILTFNKRNQEGKL